jgi:hypothetical protein
MTPTAGNPSSPADAATLGSISPASSGKLANAIPVKEVRSSTVKYGDFTPSNLPTLPFGLYYQPTDDEPTERLRDYTLVENLDTGAYSGLISRMMEKQRPSFERIVKIASEFLARAVTHFGKYPIAEIAKKMSVTPEILIQRMYREDVVTLIFACRLKVVGSSCDFQGDIKPEQQPRTPFDYAIDTECGCEDAKRIKYDPRETGDYSLRLVEIKLYETDSIAKPVFEITLPRGFSDGGKTKITKLFVEPLKWFQLGKVVSKEQEGSDDFKIMQEMIVAVPESEIYGQSKTSNPFCKELYNAMSIADIKAVGMGIKNLLDIGPGQTFQIFCYHCQKNVQHQIPWPSLAQFIYSTDELTG